jgi:catechol 2,3-dioxygenase-like lactoylglutathione lyase family enzyme
VVHLSATRRTVVQFQGGCDLPVEDDSDVGRQPARGSSDPPAHGEREMTISGFDHVALPTANPEEMIVFYGRLGFSVPDLANWRQTDRVFFAVRFGDQKINFHAPPLWQNAEFDLRGPAALPGCGDLCFVWDGSPEALRDRLAAAGAPIVAGPVELRGARGKGTSVYVRDPDENLLEFIVYGD